MKEDNFIVVHGWMISRLGLSGGSLLLYALLYSFSKTPADPGFEGWPQDLRAFCKGLMPSSSYYDAKQLLERHQLIRYAGHHIRAVVPSTVLRELLDGSMDGPAKSMGDFVPKRTSSGSADTHKVSASDARSPCSQNDFRQSQNDSLSSQNDSACAESRQVIIKDKDL